MTETEYAAANAALDVMAARTKALQDAHNAILADHDKLLLDAGTLLDADDTAGADRLLTLAEGMRRAARNVSKLLLATDLADAGHRLGILARHFAGWGVQK